MHALDLTSHRVSLSLGIGDPVTGVIVAQDGAMVYVLDDHTKAIHAGTLDQLHLLEPLSPANRAPPDTDTDTGPDNVLPIICDTKTAAQLIGIHPNRLYTALKEAPINLPGAPSVKNTTSKKPRREWRRDQVQTWWAAYSDWQIQKQIPAAKPARKRRPKKSDLSDEGVVNW